MRNLKVSKGIRPTETVEPKITPPIIINGDSAPSAFQENDNVGLESQFPEIVSDTFIVQQPQNLGQEQILIKRSRGRPKKGSS